MIANVADAMIVIDERARERDAARAENEQLRGLLRLVVKEHEPFLYNEIACFVSAPDFEKIQDELGDE